MKKSSNDQNSENPKMLSVSRVAEVLGLSERHVRREIKDGNLQVYRFGRAIRISEEDLKTYISASR